MRSPGDGQLVEADVTRFEAVAEEMEGPER